MEHLLSLNPEPKKHTQTEFWLWNTANLWNCLLPGIEIQPISTLKILCLEKSPPQGALCKVCARSVGSCPGAPWQRQPFLDSSLSNKSLEWILGEELLTCEQNRNSLVEQSREVRTPLGKLPEGSGAEQWQTCLLGNSYQSGEEPRCNGSLSERSRIAIPCRRPSPTGM